LPEKNSLKHIEITMNGNNFASVAAALDDLLSEHRFRNAVCIQVGLQGLEDDMSEADYAQLMTLALERGILQITTMKSTYSLGGDDCDYLR
jgi:hypothetical protein